MEDGEERRAGSVEAIDSKFVFLAVCREHGHRHTHRDGIVFLAKDQALPATLRFYRTECIRLDASPEQIWGIDMLIERVERYQAEYPDIVKVADIDLGSSCSGG